MATTVVTASAPPSATVPAAVPNGISDAVSSLFDPSAASPDAAPIRLLGIAALAVAKVAASAPPSATVPAAVPNGISDAVSSLFDPSAASPDAAPIRLLGIAALAVAKVAASAPPSATVPAAVPNGISDAVSSLFDPSAASPDAAPIRLLGIAALAVAKVAASTPPSATVPVTVPNGISDAVSSLFAPSAATPDAAPIRLIGIAALAVAEVAASAPPSATVPAAVPNGICDVDSSLLPLSEATPEATPIMLLGTAALAVSAVAASIPPSATVFATEPNGTCAAGTSRLASSPATPDGAPIMLKGIPPRLPSATPALARSERFLVCCVELCASASAAAAVARAAASTATNPPPAPQPPPAAAAVSAVVASILPSAPVFATEPNRICVAGASRLASSPTTPDGAPIMLTGIPPSLPSATLAFARSEWFLACWVELRASAAAARAATSSEIDPPPAPQPPPAALASIGSSATLESSHTVRRIRKRSPRICHP